MNWGSKIIYPEPKQDLKLAFNGGNHFRTLASLVPTQNILDSKIQPLHGNDPQCNLST